MALSQARAPRRGQGQGCGYQLGPADSPTRHPPLGRWTLHTGVMGRGRRRAATTHGHMSDIKQQGRGAWGVCGCGSEVMEDTMRQAVEIAVAKGDRATGCCWDQSAATCSNGPMTLLPHLTVRATWAVRRRPPGPTLMAGAQTGQAVQGAIHGAQLGPGEGRWAASASASHKTRRDALWTMSASTTAGDAHCAACAHCARGGASARWPSDSGCGLYVPFSGR